jgi:Na+-transporting NADH:ubiquinone oxidoreductase subunit NqrC
VRRGMLRKLMVIVTLTIPVGVLVAGVGVIAGGQEKAKPEVKKKGRLPAYYADIVTEAQRQQIYALQEKYAKTLTALQDQIEAIEKQRDAEIEAVLDEQQKARLKAAKAEAVAKKAKAAADRKAADAKRAGNK